MSKDMTLVEMAMIQASAEAAMAARTFFNKELGGRDQGMCGFAWVTTYEKGTSRLVRELKTLGFKKAYDGGYTWWNPSKFPCQNVDTLEAGAEAAARVLTERLGVKFYAGSRLD